jgi:TDG/mug DNA glycosylase family protein
VTLDPKTAALYEEHAVAWTAAREGKNVDAALRLVERAGAAPAGPFLDVGAGPGYLTERLPEPVIGLEPVEAFLEILGKRVPGVTRIRGEAGSLPFRPATIGAALVTSVYVHVARRRLPMALAELHRALAADAPAELVMFGGDLDLEPTDGDPFGARRYSHWPEADLRRVLVGAGFTVEAWATTDHAAWPHYEISLRRALTLPDTVSPDMDVLVCGLNPSLYSAEVGAGFGRPGNRFWPAALAAGLVTADRDPRAALADHAVGMTDLVKRATPRADELTVDEYRQGLARVEWLCEWLRPRAVCFVGLGGWRAAVDRRAIPGWQPGDLGGSAVYVMPSTSGLNAHARLDDLTKHLRAVRERGPR